MNPGEYATSIQGVRFFRRREFEPVATVWEYQTNEKFNSTSARVIFEELPDGLEICCFDPDEKEEEAYVFIRRVGDKLVLRRGKHGYMSGAADETLDDAADLLVRSPLVAKPDLRFESFRVTQSR